MSASSARAVPIVLLTLLLGACSAGGGSVGRPSSADFPSGPTPATDTVAAVGFKFAPERVTIPAGMSLRYTNGDRSEHTITNGTNGAPSAYPAFDVLLDIDATVSVTFATPGEFDVTCRFHPTMSQVVIVTPAVS